MRQTDEQKECVMCTIQQSTVMLRSAEENEPKTGADLRLLVNVSARERYKMESYMHEASIYRRFSKPLRHCLNDNVVHFISWPRMTLPATGSHNSVNTGSGSPGWVSCYFLHGTTGRTCARSIIALGAAFGMAI